MDSSQPKVVNDAVDHFRITSENTCLESLSPFEIDALFEKSRDDVRTMLKRCVLAVLNSGEETDDVKSIMARYADFSIDVLKTAGGIELSLKNAPRKAFVVYAQPVGKRIVNVPKMIEGLRQHVFAVNGPFKVAGDPKILQKLDRFIHTLIEQGRMRLAGNYTPVYEIVSQ
jgi:hypothetical protein